MKQTLFSLLVLALFATSCGKDSTTPDTPEDPTPEKTYSEVGVWTSGNYFVSLSQDKFLTAYVAPNFIDSGTYSIDTEKKISCTNSYFSRTTEYAITKIDDKSMTLNVSYQDFSGSKKTTTLNLTKSSATPAIKENSLIGKSYRYIKTSFGNITISFSSYYNGKMSSDKSNIEPYPLTLYYIYLGDKCYFQKFTGGGRTPSIGGWNVDADEGAITVYQFSFEPNGTISNFSDITSSSL